MISILHEHHDFVVVNKPANISVQNEQHQLGILPTLKAQLNLEKLWLVHRLDKVTSGCLLLAKSQQAASILSQQFQAREVAKTYLALSHKKPSKKQGKIVGGMHKIRNGQWGLDRTRENLAITRFTNQGVGNGLRLFLITPETGKTHQIRVALKSLGSPILGDKLYGGEQAERVYLHAYKLVFDYLGIAYSVQCNEFNGDHFESPDTQRILADMLVRE